MHCIEMHETAGRASKTRKNARGRRESIKKQTAKPSEAKRMRLQGEHHKLEETHEAAGRASKTCNKISKNNYVISLVL